MTPIRDIYTDQKRAEKERQRVIDSKKFMKKYNKKKSNHVNQLPGSSSANARSKRTSTCL